MEYLKSPMNYIGNKYRIISDIEKYFPSKIDTFTDLFCGGLDVSINTDAKHTVCNDINNYIIDIYKAFQKHDIQYLLDYIDTQIYSYKLSKYDKSAYLNFRNHYNASRNPLDLYVLMCYSFNYQFRFNSKHEYNNPHGTNRSEFTSVMRGNFPAFKERIDNYDFESCDFVNYDISSVKSGDFLYADPPYLLTCGSYNDGKRGFRGWSESDDFQLFSLLDSVNVNGGKFALSNVSHHKGLVHNSLLEWVKGNNYNIHKINCNYNNCNYQNKNRENITQEVLITNY